MRATLFAVLVAVSSVALFHTVATQRFNAVPCTVGVSLNVANCAQCSTAYNPYLQTFGSCLRCHVTIDDEDEVICVSHCPQPQPTCSLSPSPLGFPTTLSPTPLPTPRPTPFPTPKQIVIEITDSPTPPPTPYPTQRPTPVPFTGTMMTFLQPSTTAAETTTTTFIDSTTTTTSVATTSASAADSDESATADLSENDALFLSLDSWIAIACAAVALCCCCLTVCVVCAVRRKRRVDAERNDALAYYQRAQPAPTLSFHTATSIQSNSTASATGVVAKRTLMIHQPPSTWSSRASSLPTLNSLPAVDDFNRFPYSSNASSAVPPGYEAPTSALPNPYNSAGGASAHYIDASSPMTMMGPPGYELPPSNLKGDF